MTDLTVFRRLCPADQQAVCKTLHLPTPTPDVPLDLILIQEKITYGDAITRLERSRDMRAMIAAACLRGNITKCPADMQLTPKPYPKAGTVKAAAAPQRRTRLAVGARTLATVLPNPKKPGSAARDRYALYQPGLTDAELLAKGLTTADLKWDTQKGHITWSAK